MAPISRNAAALIALFTAAVALAQTPSNLNVSVRDASGAPVHGLTADRFTLTLDGQPQPLVSVVEHNAANSAPRPQPFDMPPGTFSDFAALAPDATLNILVLDLLNTPPAAQPLLRRQLQQFAERGNVGGKLAIYGLTDHLILLQNFNADPSVLKEAVEHKLIPRGTAATASPFVGDHDVQLMLTAANLQLLADSARSVDRQFRTQLTLDAMHTLARSLASLPGRKNILWFSTSFPLNLTPAKPPDGDELRQTAALLDSAQIAIDPIDARSALTPPSGTLKFEEPAAAEHAAIDALATDTGGTALYDQTSLTAAAQALTAVSDGYTLNYQPNASPSAARLHVHVALTGTDAAKLRLTYPTLLFADATPAPTPAAARPTAAKSPPAPATSAPATPDSAYAHAALARGAPEPEDLLFKVRVLPASTATQPTIAPGNTINPFYAVPGPWQPYDIDFIALATSLAMPADASGVHHGHFEAIVYVYDTDGRLLNSEGKTVTADPTPVEYEHLIHSAFNLHLVVSVPVRQESYIRLLLHDLNSDRFGVVEIPASAVSRLPPPQNAPLAPATPSH